MGRLPVAPLTRAAFADFGDVIELDGAHHYPINGGSTTRYHDLCDVDVTTGGGRAIVNVFRSMPLALPIALRVLEKHPLGSQAFIPLRAAPFLIVVAEPVPQPQRLHLRAFVSNGRQGVNYRRNTWHHFVLALGEVTDFLVIDRDGPGGNCDEYTLPEPVQIGWPQ